MPFVIGGVAIGAYEVVMGGGAIIGGYMTAHAANNIANSIQQNQSTTPPPSTGSSDGTASEGDQHQAAGQAANSTSPQTPPGPQCKDCDPNKGKKTKFDRSNLENKIKNYLLNPNNPQNGGKADFFSQNLGFDQSNWDQLANQVDFDQNSAVFDRVDGFGNAYYNQDLLISGANGNSVTMDGTFAVQNGAARLITMVPK